MHLPTRMYLVCLALLLGACSSIDATSPTAASLRPSAPGLEVATVDGQDFYEDEESGELIPLSRMPARLANLSSGASVGCDNDICNGSFSAYHEGNWHYSQQGMRWKMFDADNNSLISKGEETKTGGTSCLAWLPNNLHIFCIQKSQANSHSALGMSTYACRVGVWEETDHRAGWGKFAIPLVEGIVIQTGTWGEVSVTTKATGLDTGNCGPCDNPMTDTIEQCDEENPPPPAARQGVMFETGEVPGLEPPPPGNHWSCTVKDWYESTNGGPWHYTETTLVSCYLEEDRS